MNVKQQVGEEWLFFLAPDGNFQIERERTYGWWGVGVTDPWGKKSTHQDMEHI